MSIGEIPCLNCGSYDHSDLFCPNKDAWDGPLDALDFVEREIREDDLVYTPFDDMYWETMDEGW